MSADVLAPGSDRLSAQVHIGTSGWHYKHWLGNFYPDKLPASKMLAFYQQRFDTVEVNNSFYMLPKPETFSKWRDLSPAGFEFAVKASRFITHNKKLSEPENALNNFLPRAETLGEKLGPILFQLPPNWRVNPERLQQFLGALPSYHRYTFEFREASWITPQILDLLHQHNAAFCIYEIAGYQSPLEVTTDFAYVRLHGPGGKYQGSYGDQVLAGWAAWISRYSASLTAIYVYFDNDQAGFAAQNAVTLKKMLSLG